MKEFQFHKVPPYLETGQPDIQSQDDFLKLGLGLSLLCQRKSSGKIQRPQIGPEAAPHCQISLDEKRSTRRIHVAFSSVFG
jgi:hypothetical protein